MTQIGRMAGLI